MRSLLGFPNPVNEVAARLVASGVVALCVTVLVSGWTWLLAPMALGFLLRVAAGPRFSPLALLVTRVIVPRLAIAPRYVPGPPKRFAQGMGAVMSTTAAVLALGFGQDRLALLVVAAILVAAVLESGFGYCVGCRIFALAMRLGVVPASVCLECADVSARLSAS
jgi:hypothetical protein